MHFEDLNSQIKTADKFSAPNHCQCLSAQKVAELLDVHPLTVHRMLKDGRLKGMRHGRFIRVFQWSLEEYLITNTVDAENPAEPSQKKKRTVRSTSHQVAMRRLESLGL